MFLRTLRERGCQVFAVNPTTDTVDGSPCYPSLRQIPSPLDGVLVMTSPAITDQVARDCANLHILRVWMYRAGGQGAVSRHAAAFCNEHGRAVVPGECPYMFLAGEPWFHRLHGLAKRIAGSYPA
jgi:predicted CoA-binding protein